jgi:predicted enzyme related to lactoylglutathione lyase
MELGENDSSAGRRIMPPTIGNGKICYVEIPAADVASSAEFYEKVLGWKSRRRGDGALAFDDGVGQVSGSWVLGRAPASEDGLRIYIMVDSVAAALETIVANGGQVHTPIGEHLPEITARFRDPYGNVLSLYQEPG